MDCLREPYPPVNGCKKEEINHPHPRLVIPKMFTLFTLLPPCISLSILPFYFTSLSDSMKETGIQTPLRWFFGDPSPPSFQSASFPNKVVFFASTPRLPVYWSAVRQAESLDSVTRSSVSEVILLPT